MEETLKQLLEGQKAILDRLDQVDTQLIDVKASQTRMENDLTEKIRGLYDAREVQFDANDRIIGSLARIESKLDRMSLKVSSHEAILQRVK